ncbi:MAG: type II secretion system F family protein [Betaproteobacteria bacterium]|nr:type II secretion system F family protein [Betaproteobacteria bacterium]
MATQARTAVARKPARTSSANKDQLYLWEGKGKDGKIIRGELRAQSEALVNTTLRRQGIAVRKVTRQKLKRGGKIKEKDVAYFTRQMATMMRAGVPLLQSFDIVGRGHSNPAMARLLLEIKADVETGTSLSQAFRKYPLYFDSLYCNLVGAGEQAGILDTLLDRLATYKEKILALKSLIKKAMFYPVSVIIVAIIVTIVIMLFVIPVFKQVFTSFGADLPALTLAVIAASDFFVAHWWWGLPLAIGSVVGFFYAWKRSEKMQMAMDRFLLRIPVFGPLIRKSVIARWCRTLSTMFSSGVPLVESLESVGGAAGNYVYKAGTQRIQNEVSTGTSLTIAMQNVDLFPNMVVQMASIGEETGELDSMLSKVADFFEQEVEDTVGALSSLLEPFILVFLGVLIGTIVVAMYLPIFKLGSVVG